MSRPASRSSAGLLAALLFAITGGSQPPLGAAPPEVAPAPRPVVSPRVAEVSKELRDRLRLDPFYRKHIDLGGLPVLSSDKVSDAGLLEAAHLIKQMLANRPDVLKEMARRGVRFVVMAPTEMTTDVPEQRHLKNDTKTDWDKRARGLGGKITSCGEENLLNLKGDRYGRENILIHEFGHAIHNYGLASLDRKFDARLRETYRAAMEAGLWKDTYAATNHGEYWAEGVQSYFDCNNPPNKGVHNDVNTREELAKYDPALFELVDESFKQNAWRYVRYDARQKREAVQPQPKKP